MRSRILVIILVLVVLGLNTFGFGDQARGQIIDRGATIRRVSVASDGTPGDDRSIASSSGIISANGRFVTYFSDATNLVPSDTNESLDVFVHDRLTGTTERVSVDSSGVQGNFESLEVSISADGRFVAFISRATNLVPSDTNESLDVFVHDRLTGTTERVSVDSSGVQGNDFCRSPSISANGRFVAFRSHASNLVPEGANGNTADIFVHDRQTGATELASVDSSGVQGVGGALAPPLTPMAGSLLSILLTPTWCRMTRTAWGMYSFMTGRPVPLSGSA